MCEAIVLFTIIGTEIRGRGMGLVAFQSVFCTAFCAQCFCVCDFPCSHTEAEEPGSDNNRFYHHVYYQVKFLSDFDF